MPIDTGDLHKYGGQVRWWGWGLRDRSFGLDERAGLREFLARELQATEPRPFLPEPEQISLPPSRLGPPALDRLRALVAQERLKTDHATRLRHATGKSYLDLLRLRSLSLDRAPDAVIYPEDEKQVCEILRACSELDLAVVPFGGGTSVVGGVDPIAGNHAGVITLDLTTMDALREIDARSLTAVIEAGKFGPALERELNSRGYTLGHFPQSFEFSTLGGWIAARSSGQNSLLYGGIASLVVSLRVATPEGAIQTIDVPAHATGPDLRSVFTGSEGTLGVICSARVRVRPIPRSRLYFGVAFRDFESASEVAREIVQRKIPAAMIRVSDEEETRASLMMARHAPGALASTYLRLRGYPLDRPFSVMIVGLEGHGAENDVNFARIGNLLRERRCAFLGKSIGNQWLRDRFLLPYLRDELLDRGVLVETLETSAEWSRLGPLGRGIRAALEDTLRRQGARGIVLNHISHVYPDGASLYLTVVARQGTDPAAQWRELKKSANEAIVRGGGAISHHHGVGTEHRAHLHWGPAELDALRAFKSSLDPAHVLNPEKLFPAGAP